MVYFIYGNQSIRIKSQLKAIIKKVLGETDELNFGRFDFTQTPLFEILDDASYLPLGYEHKIVVVDNAMFLGKDKYKDKLNKPEDFEELNQTISGRDENVDLIFLLSSSNVDKKNEFYKLIEVYGQIYFLEDPDSKQWIDVVKAYMVNKLGATIDFDALKELSNRTSGDYASLYSNGQKLVLYTDHIKYADVDLMVTKPLEDNTFQIFNYLLNKDNFSAIGLFRDLKVGSVEPVVLISQLATQFRLLGEVLYLASCGINNDAIAEELKIKPVRVQIMRKYQFSISISRIRNTLDQLFELDKQIKSGLVDRYYAFELFLINFKNN
ncbi:MAG: DNA polymerase III subunit delta [Bacilli bacterium]|nr:DNA polymerase III subunit delta [Bacilli bacterium]